MEHLPANGVPHLAGHWVVAGAKLQFFQGQFSGVAARSYLAKLWAEAGWYRHRFAGWRAARKPHVGQKNNKASIPFLRRPECRPKAA